ncbi:MAG: copper-binding protein [Gammaproteobacteria bacterium]|nr:copper-binding protein [Gammaproteobacteria bacterium]
MKKLIPVVLLTTLFAFTPVFADDMHGKKMEGQVAQGEAIAHKATGTVKSISPAKDAITIAHGAVPTAQWPAMQMTFQIAPKTLGDIKEGARVAFEFVIKGRVSTITNIAAAK